jgi:SAM-dependent methyltransferase
MEKDEKKLVNYLDKYNYSCYNPIILNGKVFKDSHRRVFKDQGKRLDFINYKDNKILDVGCYNGFLAFEAIKRGALSYIGVDSNSQSDGLDKVLDLAKIIKENNKLDTVSFIVGWCQDLSKLVKLKDFDVVTVLSIQPANHLIETLVVSSGLPDWYNFIKEKEVYIEATNHPSSSPIKGETNPSLTRAQWRKKIKAAKKNKLDIGIELLTFTDYQDRPLIRLTYNG